MRERSVVTSQELFHLLAFIGYICNRGIDVVQQQNHLDRRRLGTPYRFERSDLLRALIIEKCELLLLKTGKRFTGLVGHDNIQRRSEVGARRRGLGESHPQRYENTDRAARVRLRHSNYPQPSIPHSLRTGMWAISSRP